MWTARPAAPGWATVQKSCPTKLRNVLCQHARDTALVLAQHSAYYVRWGPCCALQLTANYTCSGRQSLTVASTNVKTVTPPRLTIDLGKQPPPSCGGRPAVAVFRYFVRGLQSGQDFNLTTSVGPNCTAKLTYGECVDTRGNIRHYCAD
jgi:hypothetical protein